MLSADLSMTRNTLKHAQKVLGQREIDTRYTRLFGMQALISVAFDTLMREEFCTQEALLLSVYGLRGLARPRGMTTRHIIQKVRSGITPFGIVVTTVKGRGYFISAQDKARVLELLAEASR